MSDTTIRDLPAILKIYVFKGKDEQDKAIAAQITQILREDAIQEVYTDSISLDTEFIDGYYALTSKTRYDESENLIETLEKVNLDEPLSTLSLIPLSTITIQVSRDGSINPVKTIKEYSRRQNKKVQGVSSVRSLLWTIFEDDETERDLVQRHYLLTSLNDETEDLGNTINDMKQIAVKNAKLTEIYRNSRNYFSVLESGETEIIEKLEDFLWKLLGVPVKLETLESWLGYIMERNSTISAIVSSMQNNLLEAESIVDDVKRIFNRLNEKDFEHYPRNMELEIQKFEKMLKPFKSCIVRGTGLKTRLSTVMEEVRTYLSIQQQKASLEEQKASRDQLVRLVNLQETLHKLEILIVAVYLTEMAKIVFETLFHEHWHLMTAGFIPIALILSIVISRLLHKEEAEEHPK